MWENPQGWAQITVTQDACGIMILFRCQWVKGIFIKILQLTFLFKIFLVYFLDSFKLIHNDLSLNEPVQKFKQINAKKYI